MHVSSVFRLSFTFRAHMALQNYSENYPPDLPYSFQNTTRQFLKQRAEPLLLLSLTRFHLPLHNRRALENPHLFRRCRCYRYHLLRQQLRQNCSEKHLLVLFCYVHATNRCHLSREEKWSLLLQMSVHSLRLLRTHKW